MRPARGPQAKPDSPYRVPAMSAPEVAGAPRIDRTVLGVLIFVLGCSLLRFGLFVLHGERHGPDALLALAASCASAYYLRCLFRG
jgi:hypothetical protein